MIYFKITENGEQAAAFTEYIKKLPFVEIIDSEKIPNEITIEAMREARNGQVEEAENVEDLINKLND